MGTDKPLEIFLATMPGLEPQLAEEAAALGFPRPRAVAGGVETTGSWPDVWRANLASRGASRVLVRLGSFRAAHLSELDKRARKLRWREVLRADVPVSVEASCTRSKIYHSGAAAERVKNAIEAVAGVPVQKDAGVAILVRIVRDECTISIDTSGDLLYKRGFKQAIGKAPLRETQAALFLRACGYDGSQAVIDPMCGSGTIPIEAAAWAAGLQPGRARQFAFEWLTTFDAGRWSAMKDTPEPVDENSFRIFGYDRDASAIAAAKANAARAGVGAFMNLGTQAVSQLRRPDCAPGLVMVNPPYGARIGDAAALRSLYQSLGRILRAEFGGWRLGLITSDEKLARSTGLDLALPSAPVPHGPLKIRLWQADL